MRESHETDILQKCCRLCGKTSPKEQIFRLRPDEAHWFNLRPMRENKICWICRSLYAAHKENDFQKVIEKFNLPENTVPDTTNCTEAQPCYFCKICIEYEDACMFDQAEKETRVKKRQFKVKNFLMDRLINNQNDVHTRQVFHNKEPIQFCYRIEYHGDVLRKFFCYITLLFQM